MTHTRRLAVYVRSPVSDATEQRQTATLARADSLRQQGLVDDVRVTYWNRLATASNATEADDITAMEAWAAEHDCSLAPAFDRHDRSSAFTGRDSVVTLPVICLVVYEDDEIAGVYPHAGPEGHCTVADGLDRIESALQCGEELAYTGSQR
ncbi:HTH domain-containing protein [Haloarcula amylovorans]|uniref:HTH domain-containing protein n=1 Tax=Haloarcula amylovorans TaxID=2562280 RepID=UPI00107611DE|nr:HTH domain-containing protein [Halomicroarcula amylolytica]